MASNLGGAPKGEAAVPRNHFGRGLHLAAVKVNALVAHPAQHPQHLDGVEVELVGLGHGAGSGAVVVAAQAEDVVDAQAGRADCVRGDRHTRAVAGLQLHHRLQPVLQTMGTGRQAAHARRGRGAVGEVGRSDVVAQAVHLLVLGGERGIQRRRDLGGGRERARAQGSLQQRDRLGVGRRMILAVALPPVRLARGVEYVAPTSR